ncbi:uncharacterized protein LOC142902243 isoform X2 [Nelusetta ayraudi]|uniref:uncharacterized protein LOC142902243 isoform X2 n=1 Tax=Nelusetta ayraudi TaxID=303726 RepID=UPI003F703F2A
MSADPASDPLNTPVNSAGAGAGGRTLSANVRRLHNALNLLLGDREREQFIHCLNVYHAKRNVFDLVQTLKVILNTAGKRQLLPMLRLVIPRSDQLLFDQYTSEGLYLKTDLLPGNGTAEDFGDEGDPTLHNYVSSLRGHGGLVGGAAAVLSAAAAAAATSPLARPPSDGPFADMRQVTLTRSRSHEGLGFSIRGGSEHGVGIYVSLVEPDSSAEREGLRVGDQIVTVNDLTFDSVTHIEAVKVLKGCKTLAMSVCSLGRLPSGCITNHVYSWVDPLGRSVSPPPDEQDANQRKEGGADVRMVNLNMDDGRSLGLMIRGGADYGLGIYITGVDPGSAADAGDLKIGDQILEVNGQSFIVISHDEAVHILKTGRNLLMNVRDVGRLPHARKVVDEAKWICGQAIAETNATTNPSSVANHNVNVVISTSVSASTCTSRPSSARATPVLEKMAVNRGVGPPGAQVSLEQQAYMLLNEPERQTMAYYWQEYHEGHIGVQPLTMAMFELFNTHAKLSMLSEVRSLVAPQDLEIFDRLVLHREREAHQSWHGGLGVLHPHGLHTHGVPESQDGGAGAPAAGEMRATFESLPVAPPLPAHNRPSREKELQKPTARLMQLCTGVHCSVPSRPLQDCPHLALKSLPNIHQPPPSPAAAPTHQPCSSSSAANHHTSLNALHHPRQGSLELSDSEQHSFSYFPQPLHHHHHHHHVSHLSRPSSGHHTCPGFLHHRESSNSVKSEASVRFSSRSSSYEKSSFLSKSASSSKAASPMPSPHPSPFPSPCPSPSPSRITPVALLCTPDRPCSPALAHRGIVADMNRLSADSRPQQRGATLSQLSDSGQTLSEDSGVDIAEAGGLSKDGSPRPSKSQQGHAEQPGAQAHPGAMRQWRLLSWFGWKKTPAPSAWLLRGEPTHDNLCLALSLSRKEAQLTTVAS